MRFFKWVLWNYSIEEHPQKYSFFDCCGSAEDGPFEEGLTDEVPYCPLNEKCKLGEGKKEPFYVVKDDQKNTFEIVADRQGIIKITTNIRTQGTMKIYDESRKIL